MVNSGNLQDIQKGSSSGYGGNSLGVGGGGRFFNASGRALAISFGVSMLTFDTSGNLNSGTSAGFFNSGGCSHPILS